jgi:Ca-activated chloride channel family protein
VFRLLAVSLTLAAVAALPAPAQDPKPGGDDETPQIELRSDLVLVNVVATRGNGFAAGLARGDFAVAEDGTPQEIAFFGTHDTPFAAAILLDTSGSMEVKLSLARAAAARFMDQTRPKDRVAVYVFGDQVRRVQDFSPGRRDIADAIWDTSAEGNTRMYDCLDEAAASLAERQEQRRAVLLLSDGADSRSRVSMDDARRRATAAGVTVYTMDLTAVGGHGAPSGDDLRARNVLRSLAEKSAGRFFSSRGGADLTQAFAEIVDELSHQYTLGYYSSNERRDGRWRKIEVTTTQPGVALRARSGYNAPSDQ